MYYMDLPNIMKRAAENGGQKNLFIPLDVHLSPAGNKFVGEELARFIGSIGK